MEGETNPEAVPVVTEDIGLPTPPSPGRLPPPHLPPPEPDAAETGSDRNEPAPPDGGKA